MTLFALGSLDDTAVGQPTTPGDAAAEVPDLLDEPLPADAAMVDIPTTVSIVQRNADIGFDRLGEVLDDPTSWVDRDGRLFVVEPPTHPALRENGLDESNAPDDAGGATAQSPGGDDPVLAGTYPHSMAFELQSRPGASRVIYLDFDGETVSDTGWNANFTGGAAFSAEPYDTDGSPSTFSDAERTVVQNVWRRVAEDFAPFDVNVTTKDPGQAAIERTGSGDQQYGTRVLISNTTTIFSACNCGGVAYIGVFDHFGLTWPHAYYQPAWVFQRGVGSGSKGIAEAASHEAGHNLGLIHDGRGAADYYSGQGAWAPIMGVGYNQPITQWSRGEYTDPTNTEDDLVIMQQNGLPLLVDDHGNTTGTATALAAGPVDTTGIISTPADVDVFAFGTTGGTVSLGADPAAVSPNLDIALELLDHTGTVVATADPPSSRTSSDVASGLDTSISVDLPAGTYYLRVDGTGSGDPLATGYTDYGSLGRYAITGEIPNDGSPTPTPPAAVIDATATTGMAPLTVTLDGSGSTDADGTIVTHSWDLGDGTGETGPVVTHTYTGPGVFTATLTVTDDDGMSATATETITVGTAPEPEPDPRSDPEPSVDIEEVAMGGSTARAGATARATVRVADRNGSAAGGTTVTGVFSLTARDGTTRVLETVVGTTDADGTFVAWSPTVADTLRNEVFAFCVTGVTPPTGFAYDPTIGTAPTCSTWTHDRAPIYCRGTLATIVGSGTIRGTAGPDVIVGSGRRDIIRGFGGADLICGRGGNDVLFGHAGADELFGDRGRDRLVGGTGPDRLVGGPQRDRLVRDRADVLVRVRNDLVVHRRVR